jgi:hypothetical protein
MKVKLPPTGPLKWLFMLAFAFPWPVALVWAFVPNTDLGKACSMVVAYYFLTALLALVALGCLNYLERALRSCATVFKQDYAIVPICFCFNGMICGFVGSILGATIRLVTHFI